VPLTRRELLQRSAAGVALATVAGFPEQVAAASLPSKQVNALRDAVRGRVLTPGNRDYDAARVVFNKRFDAIKPPAVVQVSDAADVLEVVNWAQRYDVPLTPRSGGNAYNGASTSRDAVVVDLGGLNHISLAGTTASIEPGARNIDIYAALAAKGVAMPSGSCPNIAIGGLALGGGMGLAGRRFGLALDRIVALDVVTADGRKRTVDASHGEDLFWALRGGGGNFALVTKLHMRVERDVRQASWFRVSFPAAAREEALDAWDGFAPTAPHALTSIFTLTATEAISDGQYFGDTAALTQLVAPLARIPGASLAVGTSPYLALQERWAGCAEGNREACRTVARETFDAASIYVGRRLSAEGRRAFLAAADGGATLLCDAYGGAINNVSAHATAFVHRKARFSVQILSYAAPAIARSRVGNAYGLIAPHGNGEAYQNYPDLRMTGSAKAWYGGNRERLVDVKTTYDPDNRFRVTQGIRPRSSS